MGCRTDSWNDFQTSVGDFLKFSRDADCPWEVIITKEEKFSSHLDSDDNLYRVVYL